MFETCFPRLMLLLQLKILYTKPPTEVAIENFSGYDIQLPAVEKMDQDFANPLYCWCYTLYTAHKEEKTIEEVIAVAPELKAFAQTDSGYNQFCEQYSLAAADPKTMNEYKNWVLDIMREQGMIEGGKKEERMIWEAVVAEKDAELADNYVALADRDAALADKDAALEEKNTILADKDALIKELQNQLKTAQGIVQ